MNEPHFIHRTFSELSNTELYQILALRSEVFVLEQQCAYQDMDGLDTQSTHMMAHDSNQMMAYARILPPDLNRKGHTSIGRVVVSKSHRSDNWGKRLMQYAIQQASTLYPHATIEISAQTYLTHFYQNLGFINSGEFYLEDDIPHQTMIYQGST